MRKFFYTIAVMAIAACTTASQLDNRTFEITELNGTEYVNFSDEPASLSFENGKCNAFVGANRIFVGYEEGRNGTLTISEGGMTRMLAPEECREDEFIDALNSVASFKLEGETVTFLAADGTELFKAVSRK